jgi:hypothetical protein
VLLTLPRLESTIFRIGPPVMPCKSNLFPLNERSCRVSVYMRTNECRLTYLECGPCIAEIRPTPRSASSCPSFL